MWLGACFAPLGIAEYWEPWRRGGVGENEFPQVARDKWAGDEATHKLKMVLMGLTQVARGLNRFYAERGGVRLDEES